MKRIEVAVGVIIRGDQIFLTKRAAHQHQGGKWEFPGGKRESDETMVEALSRELWEEVGIQVQAADPLVAIHHDYSDKAVLLDVYWVREFTGEPSPNENQLSQWVSVTELQNVDFPEANVEIVNAILASRGLVT
ncbi:MAG: 8-oxo-dGTP diphosphatase MutT [Aestuariibacter sp.]